MGEVTAYRKQKPEKLKLGKNLAGAKKGEQEFDNAYSDAAQYSKIIFWDDRYLEDPEPFEWYFEYGYISETILEYIALDAAVMVAGCGNSNLIEDMVDDGYEDVCGADISRVVIAQMKVRCEDLPAVSFFQGTLCDTNLKESSFDALIDKGLFDSMICGTNGSVEIAQYIVEVERLLKDDGVFLLVSHGNPEYRLTYLEQFDIEEPFFTPWLIEVQAVEKPLAFELEELDPDDPDSMYFIYICVKNPELVKKKKVKEGKIKLAMKKGANAKKMGAPNL